MKDTCCDDKIIAERSKRLKGSNFKLLNANCQTLLSSIKNRAAGYCGIMANFHPRLYTYLCENPNGDAAEILQSFLGGFGFTENGLPYPLTAKYYMNLLGIKTNVTARNRKNEELTEYGKSCMKQMKNATDYLEKIFLKGRI